MKQNSINLDKNETKFLISLLEDGSKTDAQISKETGMSKATAGRIRKNLEEQNIIAEYIPIVDLDRIGIDIYAVAMFQWEGFKDERLTTDMITFLEKNHHVIFLANGEGSEGSTTSLFLGFEDIKEYHRFFVSFRKKYGDKIGRLVTLILPSSEIIKQDFTDLVKHVLQKQK